MKNIKKIQILFFAILIFSGCTTNPLTGQRTMAFVNNSSLFPQSFAQYQQFINENTVIRNTPEADMVTRVGSRRHSSARVRQQCHGQHSPRIGFCRKLRARTKHCKA